MSWPIKKLGELCEIKTGKSNTEDAVPNGQYAFFDRSKKVKLSSRYLFDCEALIIAGEGQEFFPKYYSGKFDLHQRAYALYNFKADVDIKFVQYYLVYNHKYFERVAVGTTAKSLRLRHFQDLQLPLPSLSEQKKLVQTLDEVFANIEKVNNFTKKNLQNSIEIFESFLGLTLESIKIKSGQKKLGEVCERVEYGTSSKSEREGKVPVLRMGNIQDGMFDWSKLVYSNDESDIKKYLLKKDDVLFNRTNSPELVGKTAIYKGEMPAIFAGYLIRIHRKENLLDAGYLNYFLNSNLAKSYGRSVVISSVNQANINGQKLKRYPIPLPSLTEQKIIVKNLDTLAEATKKLQANYKQKTYELEELKKTILRRAFSDELHIPNTTSAATKPVSSADVISPYVRNQVHAAIIDRVMRDGGWSTEVAVAKYDHLLQEVFGLPLGYEFQTHQFGPFDAKIKRMLFSGLGANKWFTKKNGMIVYGTNIRGLLFRQSNLYKNAQSIMQQLSVLGVTKLDADKVELLSTVCHSVKIKDSIALDEVREFMDQWKTDNNRTKAEKFSAEQTQKCLDFIVRNNLHQRLLKIS